jgi:hypothetical protein
MTPSHEQPSRPDIQALTRVRGELAALPALVSERESGHSPSGRGPGHRMPYHCHRAVHRRPSALLPVSR